MTNQNDDTLFFSQLDKIANDEVSSDLKTKINSMLEDESRKIIVEKYKARHGLLQNSLEGQFLDEDETLTLRQFIQSSDGRAKEEEQEIERMGAKYARRRLMFRLVFLALIGLIGLKLFESAIERPSIDFRPLESLNYETIAIEEEMEERVDFKTDVISEVADFFANHPDSKVKIFSPKEFKGWEPAGASILDYEITVIGAAVYTQLLPGRFDVIEKEVEDFDSNGELIGLKTIEESVPAKDIMVHYRFYSEKNWFPSSSPEVFQNREYFVFGSDQFNMIMWEKEDFYDVLVGRSTPQDLAAFAFD